MIAQASQLEKKQQGTTKARDTLDARAEEQNKRRRLSLAHGDAGDPPPVNVAAAAGAAVVPSGPDGDAAAGGADADVTAVNGAALE